MGEKWTRTTVFDLKVGDLVRLGDREITEIKLDGSGVLINFDRLLRHTFMQWWPGQDVVEVQRAVEVTISPVGDGWWVNFGHPTGHGARFTCERHAESYADMLRNDPERLAEARGDQ